MTRIPKYLFRVRGDNSTFVYVSADSVRRNSPDLFMVYLGDGRVMTRVEDGVVGAVRSGVIILRTPGKRFVCVPSSVYCPVDASSDIIELDKLDVNEYSFEADEADDHVIITKR